MNEVHISKLLLERYHMGEVTSEERNRVEKAIAQNSDLVEALFELDRSDIDFKRRFPKEVFFHKSNQDFNKSYLKFSHQTRRIKPVIWGLCAAALVLIIAVPLVIFKNASGFEFDERMKGVSSKEPSLIGINNNSVKNDFVDLSVFVRGNSTGEIIELSNRAFIDKGNTIQLVYHVLGDDLDKKHGVIFSIDGRSCVTLHFPYKLGQETQLISGRNIPLDEAYTLDDAPRYEIFFFIVDDNPIDVRYILNTADRLALQIEEKPYEAEQMGITAFLGYEVKVFTLLKE